MAGRGFHFSTAVAISVLPWRTHRLLMYRQHQWFSIVFCPLVVASHSHVMFSSCSASIDSFGDAYFTQLRSNWKQTRDMYSRNAIAAHDEKRSLSDNQCSIVRDTCRSTCHESHQHHAVLCVIDRQFTTVVVTIGRQFECWLSIRGNRAVFDCIDSIRHIKWIASHVQTRHAFNQFGVSLTRSIIKANK